MSMVLGTKQLYTHARVVTLYIISNRVKVVRQTNNTPMFTKASHLLQHGVKRNYMVHTFKAQLYTGMEHSFTSPVSPYCTL